MPDNQKAEPLKDDQDYVTEYDAKNNAMEALYCGSHNSNADAVKALVLEVIRPIWKHLRSQIDPSLKGEQESEALHWARSRAQYETFKKIPWEQYTTPERAERFRKHILTFLPYSERETQKND